MIGKRLIVVAAGLVASGLSVPLPALAQDKISISIGHITASDSYGTRRSLWPLRDALEKTGKVKVTLYGTGTPFSNPTKFSELVEKGVLDIAFGVQQFEPGRFPLNLLAGEPFVIGDNVKGAVLFNRAVKATPALMKEFEPNLLMNVSMSDGEHLHSHKTVIKTIDDAKGLRIMVTNPGVQTMLREVGASVVALPSTTTYENLQKGVVDAVSASWVNVLSFNLNEVTVANYELNSAAQPLYLVMNRAKYASLPPDVKKVIDDYSTDEVAANIAQLFADASREQRTNAMSLGHTVITASVEEREAYRKRFQHLTDARVQELEKKGLPASQFLTTLLEANRK